MVIWITGLSATGKTTFGKNLLKRLKKKYKKDIIFIDGDDFRYLVSNDLGYTINDRDKNASRITKLIKYISDQKFNFIVSGNLTSLKFRKWCKKNIKDYIEIYIHSNINDLFNRDKKNIYKKNNVVGVDLEFVKPNTSDIYIDNDKSKKKFISQASLVENFIKKNKIRLF